MTMSGSLAATWSIDESSEGPTSSVFRSGSANDCSSGNATRSGKKSQSSAGWNEAQATSFDGSSIEMSLKSLIRPG